MELSTPFKNKSDLARDMIALLSVSVTVLGSLAVSAKIWQLSTDQAPAIMVATPQHYEYIRLDDLIAEYGGLEGATAIKGVQLLTDESKSISYSFPQTGPLPARSVTFFCNNTGLHAQSGTNYALPQANYSTKVSEYMCKGNIIGSTATLASLNLPILK